MLVALKAENIFKHSRPADENFSFDYFLRLSRQLFRLCVLSPFFRKHRSLLHQKRVDTDTEDRNKEKRRPFFLKRIFKERKHFLFNLLDLK